MFEGQGQVFQNCYIVDDIDQAIDNWVTTIGAGPFFVQRDLHLPIEYRGSPSTIDIHLAIGQAGGVHIELIQVLCDNPTVYTDLHPRGGGGGFHHLGMLAKDFEAAVKAYQDAGHELGMRGIFGETPFAFIDTTATIGFFTEFHADTAEIRGMFQRIADAAVGWKGDRPIRPMTELLQWMEPA